MYVFYCSVHGHSLEDLGKYSQGRSFLVETQTNEFDQAAKGWMSQQCPCVELHFIVTTTTYNVK